MTVTDQKIFELVKIIESLLDQINDAGKVKAAIKVLNFEKLLTDMLQQEAECAIFICKYLQPSYASTYQGESYQLFR